MGAPLFISLEGPDGSGKTTQAALLVARLQGAGREVVAVHEPGGTELGTALREVLLQFTGSMDPWAEALLFVSSRAQLVAEIIQPALARGAVVVADRYSDSTIAYQTGGRGLPEEKLRALVRLAERGVTPGLTLLLDVSAAQGLSRREAAGPETWTRFEHEDLEFHQRVRATYLRLADAEPERWVVLDAARAIQEVADAVWKVTASRLSLWERTTVGP